MAEAAPLGRPLHQARHVGHDELDLVASPSRPPHPHHAQVGLEGGEGVVGHLGLGRGDRRDEGGLADVGEPHQGHVGHQLELDVEPPLLAPLALLGEGRRPAGVGEEPGVAPAPPAALGGQPPVPRARQVAQQRPVVGSRTTVPTGTGTRRSTPRAPWRRLPEPWPPSVARRWGWSRKPSSEAWFGVETSQTSPPRPPSPPSGPPRSTWASRRKETAPAPPSPALAWIWASSTNPDMAPILRGPPTSPPTTSRRHGPGAPPVGPPGGVPRRRRPSCTCPPPPPGGRPPTRR